MTLKPAIDYTNKDYASLRQAMFDLARYRLPEWTDRSPADLGVLMVDLFAYMGDVLLYYQDRIANESFLATATERRSVLQLLRLIGYELKPPLAAYAELTLFFKAPPGGGVQVVKVPQGAQFATVAAGTAQSLSFEYLGPDLEIDLNSAQVQLNAAGKPYYQKLPVRHSSTVTGETLGSSSGEANQTFALGQAPLILESLVVEVFEGARWVIWDRRENLLYYTGSDGRVTVSGPEARDYYVQFDENDQAQVLFGDGVYGRVPPVGTNNIRASYRVGGGIVGNVPAGAINSAKTPLNFVGTTTNMLEAVTNPEPAAGGADHESSDHAARFGPLAYRSGQRAVTLSDYIALAYQAGGVAKVRASSRDWNQIDLYIAPEGDTCRPVPEDMKKRIIAYFEDKRMLGTFVRVQDPICVPVDISLEVVYDPHYRDDTVRQTVEDAINALLNYQAVDFGQILYLSSVYRAVESLPGVLAVTVTRFQRQQAETPTLQEQLAKLGITASGPLPDFLQRAIQGVVQPEGRLELGDYEIPTLGKLEVLVKEAAR